MIFNNIPKPMQMSFLGGPLGNKLSFYPLIFGIIYTVYANYKNKAFFAHKREVCFYTASLLGILLISLLWGLVEYPFYSEIIDGPAGQIDRLPKVLGFLNAHGIGIEEKQLLQIWLLLRPIKGLIVDIFYTSGASYLIYLWYRQDWNRGFIVAYYGIIASLVIVIVYCIVEVFYLAHNPIAADALKTINPYIHIIKTNHNWWPPLLWKGQLRAVFPEPSHIGNYLAFCLPFLWYRIIKYNARLKELLLLLAFVFIIFLSKARTATAMFLGLNILMASIYIIAYKAKYLSSLIKIIGVSVIGFWLAVAFISNFMITKNNFLSNIGLQEKMMVNSNLSKTNNIKSTQSMETYISDNITSLATSNKRSNGARYASIKAGIRTGLQSPFLGVGQGIGTAYIAKNFTSEERKNGEVKMWLTNQQKQGIMKAPIGAMNEYVQRFAENGCIGLTVFLTPFIFVLYRAVKILLKSNGQSLELITLLSALVGCLVAGMNGSLNLMFTVWVVLGLLYAAILVNENTGSINERA